MKVFVARAIPGDFIKTLSEGGIEVAVSEFDRPLTPQELLEKAAGSDVVLSLLTDFLDGDVMDAIGPQLKLISNYAVGFDNVNVADATDRGIIVTHTPSEAVNEAVAEHTWALILSLSRRIVEADEATKRGAYKGWEPDSFLGLSLKGKTLGIVGLGNIGTKVAERARGYGVNILYNKRTRDEKSEKELGISFCSLDELFNKSDIITLHVPLTDETRHLVNKDSLSKMKKGSFLINTARGPVVCEHDLAESLRSGHLGGAALDVFETEPNIDPELIGMENVVLTPHIASATHEARDEMGALAIEAIFDFSKGIAPQNMVDEKVWQKRRK